jgi:hypothetical protein
VEIEVAGPEGRTGFPTVFVDPARPQVFTDWRKFASPGTDVPRVMPFAVAYNEDGTLNTFENPASKGSVVTTWVSGVGLSGPLSVDGMEVLYAGQAPGLVTGLWQVNFRIPADAFVFGPALWTIAVRAGDAISSGVSIGVTK